MKTPAARPQATSAMHIVPVAVTLVLAIIMLLPLGSGISGQAMPHLVMISCFYWLSSRPLTLPYGACAALGLLLDLWLGLPMGLNMAVLLLTRLFILNQLKYYRGKNRAVYWAVFSGMALVLFGLMWIVQSIVEGQLIDLNAVFFQWLMTSFFYAPIAFILSGIRRWLM